MSILRATPFLRVLLVCYWCVTVCYWCATLCYWCGSGVLLECYWCVTGVFLVCYWCATGVLLVCYWCVTERTPLLQNNEMTDQENPATP